MSIRSICLLTGKANGKPNTTRDYFNQRRDARSEGFRLADCPYYSTSTAETQWRKGYFA